ncbi:hypothetical protein HYV49_03050 [Candidatus Pacearchaeota archaeon]|nr:hypothetical protein [Candidatus Pacearchaeota archaeon]
MKFVLDNNVLFSLMNPLSISSYLFSSINAEFIAPEFIKREINKYEKLCLSKSKLSEYEFEIRQKEIFELIEFFSESAYDELLTKVIKNLSDPGDSPYLALALLTNSAIWSNDPHLKKQSLVPVLTTSDLVKLFLEGRI